MEECQTLRQKAYDLIGDDHWSFYAVASNKDKPLKPTIWP